VQSGNCRTGSWFACQGESVTPDVITTAKALANGVPMGACMAAGRAAGVFEAGHHGSTYGGNPLACAAALAVVETMEREKLAAQAADRGAQILAGMQQRLGDIEGVRDIRGRGLMIGIELEASCGELVAMGLERGLLINVAAGNTVRLLPPLIIDEGQSQALIDGVCESVEVFLQRYGDEPAGRRAS
jgi:acetylornithine aminotransferase